MPGTTDTVKAILTPGEFVIRKEAVDMIGAPMLNMINNMPEKGGHSNIDNLIAKATMENMKGMYGGGMVQAGPKPMGTGGMVDAYRGGGMVMDQYGHGGMVNKNMMSYKHGGKVHKNLKPVPKDNPGLAKLPEAVRNKMGYMQEGGMVEDSLMGMMGGGMADKKKKMYSYQEGGKVSLKDYAGLVGDMVTAFGGNLPKGMYTPEGGLTREGFAQKFNLDPESVNIDTLSFSNPANYMFEVRGKKKDSGADVTGTTRATGSLPIEGLLDTVMEKNIEDPFERMRFQVDLSNLKKAISYKNGGMVGYQDGGMIGPPLPPEMMGQAMNQQLSESIDMRMANPEVYQGSTLGAVRNQAMMLQDSIEQDTVNKARNSLKLMALIDSLKQAGAGESVDYMPMRPMPSTKADSMRVRDLMEFLNMQQMQRGMGSVKQGMGDEPMRLLR